MFFKKVKKDTDTVVQHLSLLRFHQKGKSIFLENDAIETDAVKAFINQCAIPYYRYLLMEDILRFAITYNVLSVYLNLKNISLQQEILTKLRDPGTFLKNSGRQVHSKEEKAKIERDLVENGFSLLMDNLSLSEREIMVGTHEILAARFMNFISDGQFGVEDDKPTWLAFGFAIYQELNRLPPKVTSAKRKLGLK